MSKTTLILGASENPERYSNKALLKLKAYNHPVVAIGNKKGIIDGTTINVLSPTLKINESIDTITLYIGKKHQPMYYNLIKNILPKRIIFNPGTENEELVQLANEYGIDSEIACTLVLLATDQY